LGIFSGRANLPLTHVKLPNWQEKNLSISHRGGAGREKKYPAAHGRSIYRHTELQSKSGVLIIEGRHKAKGRRRKKSGDRTKDVTWV
jgi:hypothetical protein